MNFLIIKKHTMHILISYSTRKERFCWNI